jgi:RNA polymerase sigma factor (sigma-70 family)
VPKEIDELVLRLQSSWDDQLFLVLWKSLRGKADHMVRHYRVNGMSEDDLRQELLLDLIDGIKTWNPIRGRNSDNWIDLRWKGHMCTLVLHSHTLSNEALSTSVSLSGAIGCGKDEERQGETQVLEELFGSEDDTAQRDRVDELRWRLMVLMRDLTRHERKCAWLFHKGWKFREIAARLHCSEKSVDNTIRRCRVKARNLANGDWEHIALDESRGKFMEALRAKGA